MLSLSIITCYHLTSKLFQKFQHPIVVSLEQPISVDTLPFPAVTFMEPMSLNDEFRSLSFQTEVMLNKNRKFVNEYITKRNLVETYFTQLVICGYAPYMYRYLFKNYEDAFVQTLLNFSYAHQFERQEALWNSQFETVFAKRLTAQGFGYSFNMLDVDKILNIDE